MKLKLLVAGMFLAMAIAWCVVVADRAEEPKRSSAFGGWGTHYTCVCSEKDTFYLELYRPHIDIDTARYEFKISNSGYVREPEIIIINPDTIAGGER